MVWSENASRDEHQFPVSAPDYRDWKAGGVFSHLAAFEEEGRNLRLGGRSERVDGIGVTDGFFEALAIPPQLGRVFGPQDMQPGQAQVAILGHGLWRSRFAADPAVIGTTVVLDGAPHTIIGVLPRSFPKYGKDPIYSPALLRAAADSDRAPGTTWCWDACGTDSHSKPRKSGWTA